MSPQTERTFDEAATACARLHYYEEGHVFQGLLEVDESLHAAMTRSLECRRANAVGVGLESRSIWSPTRNGLGRESSVS